MKNIKRSKLWALRQFDSSGLLLRIYTQVPKSKAQAIYLEALFIAANLWLEHEGPLSLLEQRRPIDHAVRQAVDALKPFPIQHAHLKRALAEIAEKFVKFMGHQVKSNERTELADHVLTEAARIQVARSGAQNADSQQRRLIAIHSGVRRGRFFEADYIAARLAPLTLADVKRRSIYNEEECAKLLDMSVSAYRSLLTSTPLMWALNKLYQTTGYLDPSWADARASFDSEMKVAALKVAMHTALGGRISDFVLGDAADPYFRELEAKYRNRKGKK